MNVRLPPSIKALTGTVEPAREKFTGPPIVGTIATGETPDLVSDNGSHEERFHRMVTVIDGMGAAAIEDTTAAALLTIALSEVAEANEVLRNEPHYYESVSNSGSVVIKKHPAMTHRADAMRRAQSLLVEFGLTPVARARVAAAAGLDTNPFDEF